MSFVDPTGYPTQRGMGILKQTISDLETKLRESEAENAKLLKIQEEWHQAHWKADMEAVNEYKTIAKKAIDDFEHEKAKLRESEAGAAVMRKAIDIFFHHWDHGGISRDNQFHNQTAMHLKVALSSDAGNAFLEELERLRKENTELRRASDYVERGDGRSL